MYMYMYVLIQYTLIVLQWNAIPRFFHNAVPYQDILYQRIGIFMMGHIRMLLKNNDKHD